MKLHWFTARAVFFLTGLAVCSANASPKHDARVLERPSPRFGQTIAFSDFDSDGFIDEARLDGSVRHERVGILLSGSGKRVSLHFGSKWINHGSLFAKDFDDDGTADLIWSDLLHARSVIVWLGDGSGRFKRVSAPDRPNGFTLGADQIAPPDPDQETAINFEDQPALEPPLIHQSAEKTHNHNGFPRDVAPSLPSGEPPADRGPPAFLH